MRVVSKEEHKKIMGKLDSFFSDIIDPNDFAHRMRGLMRATLSMYLSQDDNTWRANIDDAYFYFEEFCECLSPIYEDEES